MVNSDYQIEGNLDSPWKQISGHFYEGLTRLYEQREEDQATFRVVLIQGLESWTEFREEKNR